MGIWWPQLDIRSGEAVSASNPFDTSFFIRNEGVLPIDHIEFTCGLRDVQFAVPRDAGIGNLGFGLPDTDVPRLRHGESHSIEFDRLFVFAAGTRIAKADIEVLVTYSPFLIPIRLEKSQRFKMVRTGAKQVEWVPLARSK
jgi:hypothetical protein